ncbi:HdeD family acid-resistance protein [Shewanella sp. 125m-7]
MENPVNTMLTKGWKWFIMVGVVVTLAGFFAISLPVAAGMTITTIIGVIFLVIGLVQLYHTLSIPKWKAKFWYVVSALFYLIGGILILAEPFVGLFTITVMMIVIMLFNGVTRMFFGFNSRGNLEGWRWIVFSGLLSTAIAVYFFTLMNNPEFSLSLLGIFMGVSFIFEGISFIFIGMQMKNVVAK